MRYTTTKWFTLMICLSLGVFVVYSAAGPQAVSKESVRGGWFFASYKDRCSVGIYEFHNCQVGPEGSPYPDCLDVIAEVCPVSTASWARDHCGPIRPEDRPCKNKYHYYQPCWGAYEGRCQ